MKTIQFSYLSVVTIGLLVFLTSDVECACGDWTSSNGDLCLKVIEDGDAPARSIVEARDACLALGGDLVSVIRAVDKTQLETALTSDVKFFTNLNDIDGGGYVSTSDLTADITPDWDGASEPADGSKCTLITFVKTPTTTTWEGTDCCTPNAAVNTLICEKPDLGSVNVVNNNNTFKIECLGGINDCVPDPCQNNGTCTDEIDGVTCDCVDGFAGDLCETDLCENEGACQNGGTCMRLPDQSYNCTCGEHYTGPDCETIMNKCMVPENPCQFNSNCTPELVPPYSYTCDCVEGTEGDDCETNIDDCDGIDCLNGGACDDEINGYNCVCAGSYTGVHCETYIDCGAPDTYANTTIAHVPADTSLGDTAIYTCTPVGYKFPDMETEKTVTCTGNNYWEPVLDACGPHCDFMPTVVNAEADNPNTAMGHMLNFTCDLGYQFPDNTTSLSITCNPDLQWSTRPSDLPACEIIHCPELPTYPDQEVDTDNNTYGTTVTFWCDVGYTLIDDTTARTIYCTEEGEWSVELPPCEAVQCPEIGEIEHGTSNDTETTYDTYVEYKCDDGYRMWDGGSWRILRCDATGEWSDNVTDCADNRCFPLPYVRHATPSKLDASHGSEVVMTCIRGHRFHETDSIKLEAKATVCQTTGRWNPVLTECLPVKCPVLTDELELYDISNAYPSSDDNLYGSEVSIDCILGHYYPDNSSSLPLECMEDEQWNNTDYQSCTPVKCIAPPDVENGTRFLPDVDHYEYLVVVRYECNPDYKFIDGYGTRNITCEWDGHWDLTDISCRKDRCDPVPRSDNTNPSTLNTSWYTNVTFECNEGFEWDQPGNSFEIQCTNEGTWSTQDVPSCTPKQCPFIENVVNTTHNGSAAVNDRIYGAYIAYTCLPGHKYEDDITVKSRHCDVNGNWAPPVEGFPGCEIIECPPLPAIENATLDTNETFWGLPINYTCKDGYQFPDKDRAKTVKCSNHPNSTDPVWEWFDWASSDIAKHGNYCEVVFCPPVPQWGDYNFYSTDNEFEATINYSCKEGYAFFSADGLPDTVMTVELEDGTTMEVLESYCGELKQWEPAIVQCMSHETIGADLVGVTYDAPGADIFGDFTISMLAVIGILIVVIDIPKMYMDASQAKAYVAAFIAAHKHNRVSDSNAQIEENPEAEA